MQHTVRQPKQQRSIDKKNKLIEVGLRLFCEKGFHGTNATEIAAEAGVSVGILYSYFTDKKDIFLQSLHLYFARLYDPAQRFLASCDGSCPKADIARRLMEILLESHSANKVAHEEMLAMSHLDEDVSNLFVQAETTLVKALSDALVRCDPNMTHPAERTHIALNILDDLCHEYIYHRHDYIDYGVMFAETVRLLSALLDG